ncbi:MAG TPA: Tex family protein, partial [Gammaproteobacteria bacterium]|nr:Tex family protein [Gammaproteobacteria bacterium]
VADAKAALEGARAILIERWGEDAALLGELREWLAFKGMIRARVVEGKEAQGAKYADYFDHAEPLATIPSHRLLALFRGRREEILQLDLEPVAGAHAARGPAGGAGADGRDAAGAVTGDARVEAGHAHAEACIARRAGVVNRGRPADVWLETACRLAWRGRIHMHLMLDLFNQAREKADDQAIAVFGDNLKDLLLAAPAGPRTVLGLDPGLRTGVKVAAVDATGKLLATGTIYPHEPKRQWEQSLTTLAALCKQCAVELVAIGNGTASRETDRLAAELIKRHPELKLTKIVVSEAGASVYSASALAARELPELDVSLRGAVSIARRLQDPLAELVKIEPKSIGVGQYQHDVDQPRLARALDARVEDCVNNVGVYVNTASGALLTRVSGLSKTVAENIIDYRDANGPFRARKDLKKVPRLGPKAFEQCAGFLRIAGGDDPLDASAVHPEAYPVVARIVEKSGRSVPQLIGDGAYLRALNADEFADEHFGLPTVRDILKELEKPGRDPRPEFKAARFAEGVEDIADLKPGLILEGVVSNVAAFGAFVDVGVHQDGLVHISAMSDKFIKDPREVVKAGDVVKVKVLEVDIPRRRISLSLRLDDDPGPRRQEGTERKERPGRRTEGPERQAPGAKGGRATGHGGKGARDTEHHGKGARDIERGGAKRERPQAGPYNTALADAFERAKRK